MFVCNSIGFYTMSSDVLRKSLSKSLILKVFCKAGEVFCTISISISNSILVVNIRRRTPDSLEWWKVNFSGGTVTGLVILETYNGLLSLYPLLSYTLPIGHKEEKPRLETKVLQEMSKI